MADASAEADEHAASSGSPPIAETQSVSAPVGFIFDAEKGKAFRALIKIGLLSIPTLTLYRFWGKTALRRYLWRGLSLDGDRFEYHGTAKELLIGFLIAIAILAPIFILYELLSRMTVDAADSALSTLIDAGYALVLFSLWQIARYRMTRYRLTRTSWRSIRFGLEGSSFRYTQIVLLWALTNLLTLGLAYPKLRYEALRYRIENARFGSSSFLISAKGGDFYKIWVGPAILAYGGIALVIIAVIYLETASAPADSAADAFRFFGPLGLLGLVCFGAAHIWYRAKELALLPCSLRVSAENFSAPRASDAVLLSSLSPNTLLGTILFGVFKIAFIMACVGVVIGIVLSLAPAGTLTFAWQTIIVAGAVMLLALNTLPLPLLYMPVFQRIAETTNVRNLSALESSMQRDRAHDPQRGEGLADALDVGAI